MSILRQNQRTIREYRKVGEPWPATAKDIAEWAIRTQKWEMQQSAYARRCAEDMAEAMREEYYTDKGGRRVRLYHPARIKRQGELLTEWDDIRSARSHMQLSFQHARRKIAGECRQLKTDLDSTTKPTLRGFDAGVQEMDILEVEAAEAV